MECQSRKCRHLIVENKKMKTALAKIMNMCIGQVTMGYAMDGCHIGQIIYEATGKNAEEQGKSN